MKTKKLLLLIGAWFIAQCLIGQTAAAPSSSMINSAQQQIDEQKAREFFVQHNYNPKDYDEYITSWRKHYTSSKQQSQRTPALPPVPMAACTNVDFEAGNLNGWTATTGYNPNYNAIGCCPSAGGAQNITSGTGVDPFGLFPIVCSGGTYSLKLGDANVGGIADRMEQTFQVTASNSNYSYKYAVVLEDPGHTAAQQPQFTIEMLDSSGNQIPCTFYQVAAGQGIPGFQNSTVQSDVVFKPWTTVAVNLTNYIGQNVTIRFTTYDCALGGHFGYAYIDGSCQSFQIIQNNTLCSNSTAQICAPTGFAGYNWSGTGIVSGGNTSCATINAAGTYTVQLTSVTGCTSPITFIATSIPAPIASFTTTNQTCSSTLSYTNTSVGTGLSSFWSFGDNTTSTTNNPTHTFPSAGIYTTSLIAYSTNGCSDTTQQIITVFPQPNAAFIYTSVCQNSNAVFTNNSTVSGGTIVNNNWSFGDGASSLIASPAHIYTSSGNYNVKLTVTDNHTCKDSTIHIESIYNLPVAGFNATSVCEGSGTAFTNTSSVVGSTIASSTWDFTNDGIIDNTTQNPSNVYASSGTYSVVLQVTSAQGCINNITNTVVVNPNPTVAFSVNNACEGSTFSFTNNSTVANGSITQNNWNFGDNGSSTTQNPQHVYPTAGTYNVTLTETSNYGCTANFTQSVIAYPNPTVNFSASPVCQLQASIFNNTSTIASGSIASYSWDFTSDGIIDNTTQNPNYTYSQGGNFVCTLQEVSDMGCVSTGSNTVTVYLNPVANFNAPAVCNGTAMQFADASTSQNGTINAWAWDFTSNGTFDANGQNVNNTYPSDGTYSVTLQVTSSLGCPGSITHTVIVNPNPNVLFTVNNACEGNNFTFSNNSTINNGSIAQSLWSFGDNSSNSTQIAPQHTYANANTYNVTLTETSNFGCIASATQNVTAYPKPNVSFSTVPVCQNQASVFNNTSSIASGNISSYNWDFNSDGAIDNTTQNPNYTYSQGGNYICVLNATSDMGCTNSATNTVTVYYNPVANFSAPSTCDGKTTQFTDASTSQSGIITVWDWDFTGDGTIDNVSQNPSYAYTSVGSFLATLQVQSSYGCANTIQKPVRINATPVASFTLTQNHGCPQNMCVGMINNSTISGGSIANWLWNFGDGAVSSTQNSPIHCFNSGTHSISLMAISDSGCTSSYTLANAVTVYPKPTAGFAYSPQDVDITEPMVTIENEAIGATTYAYYISDGTTITGLPGFSHTFTSEDPQTYTAWQLVTNSYGCRDSVEHDIIVKPGYTFYIPNAFTPNGDGTNETFKGTGIGIKTYTMMIFNRWGEMIFKSDDLERGWDGTYKGKGGDTVQQDVYVWKVQLTDGKNKEHDFEGTVSVVK